MSIKAKPWEGGGAASVPDASETTKGKIKIATTTESNTGTDDLTAMTPAKVKARIDAALVGGVEYKGDIAVSNFSTLLNAEKGDLYKISTGGTAGDGRVYAVGDSIIVNADMGGTFADSKLDKIDNTENITSVNGQTTGAVNIYADDTVLNIAGTGLSISGSGATSTLNADSATTSASGIIEIATNAEATAGSATDKALVPSNLSSVGTSQLNNDAGFITSVASASESTAGIIEIATNAEATAGSATDKALVPSNLASVGTSQLNNDAGFITSVASASESTAGIIEIATNAEATTGSATDKALVPSNLSSVGTSQLNNDAGFITSVASASESTAGIIEIATNAEATAGSATDKALVPSNLASVGTSQLNNDAGFITSVASASESTAGIIEIATNAEATTGSATDKALVPSNLSSVGTSQLNNDAGFITSAGAGLSAVVDDTSPQLGGDLDLNSNKLTTASNGNLELTPHGTGHIKLGGNTNSAEVRFFDEAGTNYVALKAPADADISGDYTLTLPVDDGTADQVLKTDGSGVLSWTDQSAGGGGGYTYSAKTTSFSAAADYHYSCTNAITATLPAASSNANKSIRIKVMGTDTVTIGRNGSDKIDGVASDYSMAIQYSSITLFSNGSDGWEII